MHGLNTINELNKLAADNNPVNVEANLAQAEALHKGSTKLAEATAEVLAHRAAEREEIVARIAGESFEQLIQRLEGLQWPSTLEEAVARKLRAYLAKFAENENHPGILPEQLG